MSAPPAVEIDGVSKTFGTVRAVDDVSLSVPSGAFVSLLGPSGCGKTTLLRMIGGFERQDGGEIRVHGERVDHRPPNKRPVNMVFQRYALFPHKTVEENIAFPLVVAGVKRRERADRVRAMLELIRLPDVGRRRPGELSGGQAQRIALARALVGQPRVLLLDEPLAALDLKLRKAMQIELRRIQESLGTTFLFVTHDQEEALAMSDLVVLMDGGRIVQQGTPQELYENPRSVFASDFIGEANLLLGRVAGVDGATASLELACGRALAPANGRGPGDEIALSIRPEHLELSPAGTAPDADRNALAGVVVRGVFLGSAMRVLVEVGDEQVVTVECAPGHGRAFPIGTPVVVAWPVERGVVVPAR